MVSVIATSCNAALRTVCPTIQERRSLFRVHIAPIMEKSGLVQERVRGLTALFNRKEFSDRQVLLACDLIAGYWSSATSFRYSEIGQHMSVILSNSSRIHSDSFKRELNDLGATIDPKVLRWVSDAIACKVSSAAANEDSVPPPSGFVLVKKRKNRDMPQAEPRSLVPLMPLDRADNNIVVEIIGRIKAGGSGAVRARKELQEGFHRMNSRLAKRYVRDNILFDDLLQEANIALFKAANKYDAGRGMKFCVYAKKWINRSLIDYVLGDMPKSERICYRTYILRRAMERFIELTLNENGIEPTPEELSKKFDVSVDRVLTLLEKRDYKEALRVEIESSREVEQLDDDPSSDERKIKVEWLDFLSPRQRRIVELRYGTAPECSGEGLLSPQIGKLLGISSHCVNVHLDHALKKLRAFAKNSLLESEIS